MNIEKSISAELSAIGQYISAAVTQYQDQGTTPNNIAPDYHVLFILVKKIKIEGATYSTTSTMEAIFKEAVVNFKHSVEKFAKYNVHIVPTIKEISATVSIEGTRHYLIYEDIYNSDDSCYLRDYTSVGLYDAVIVASAPCNMGGAVTTLGMFQFENILHGFTHAEICTGDSSLINHGYDNSYPHLTTTNYFIHEWLHQLEGYRSTVVSDFPDTHGYTDPSAYGYTWEDDYFDDTSVYPHVVEPYLTSFYRAVLAAEVTHATQSGSRAIGMFPLLWKITPRKLLIGRYIVQNSAGTSYYYNNNGSYSTSANLTNSISYVWNVYYSLANSSLKIRNYKGNTATLSISYTTLKFTRVGPYDEGEYLLVNTSLSETVLGYTSNNALAMYNYRSNTTQTFRLEYFSELYFKLSPQTNLSYFLDLYNNWDTEDNTVSLYTWTGYPEAQTWQYRYDGSDYKIMPLKSPHRSLSFHDNGLHITSTANVQKWRPELVSNGKFVFEGNYKIKASNGKYLTFSGNTLKLSTTPKVWTITAYSDNYYKIHCTSGSTTYYIDVLNAYDIEGNTVQVQYATSYTDAQTWKFMLQNDGTVLIVPRLSLRRGISSTTSSSTLTTSPMSFELIKQ
jgi:hypothetical protein